MTNFRFLSYSHIHSLCVQSSRTKTYEHSAVASAAFRCCFSSSKQDETQIFINYLNIFLKAIPSQRTQQCVQLKRNGADVKCSK